MNIILAIAILFFLTGCQSAGKPSADGVAATINMPGAQWQGFCKPTTNERGEIIESKDDTNSARPELETISENEFIWITTGFKDDSCKERFNGSKTYIKCETSAVNADGFRSCAISKFEMAGFHKVQVDKYNKNKSCGQKSWIQEGWVDVTNSTCKETSPFIFKMTTEEGLLTLRTQSQAGTQQTSKFKKR